MLVCISAWTAKKTQLGKNSLYPRHRRSSWLIWGNLKWRVLICPYSKALPQSAGCWGAMAKTFRLPSLAFYSHRAATVFQDPQSDHLTRGTTRLPKVFQGLKVWQLQGHFAISPKPLTWELSRLVITPHATSTLSLASTPEWGIPQWTQHY